MLLSGGMSLGLGKNIDRDDGVGIRVSVRGVVEFAWNTLVSSPLCAGWCFVGFGCSEKRGGLPIISFELSKECE
jgi:hypothetical protein